MNNLSKKTISKHRTTKSSKRILAVKNRLYKFIIGLKDKKALFALLALAAIFLFLNKDTKEIKANEVFINVSSTIQALPEMIVENGNTIKPISSPLFFSSNTLATIAEEDTGESKDIVYYTVKEGDTLWGIAQKNNISLNTLLLANELEKNAKIQPGQKLVILPTEGIMHMVEDGETVASIAQKYQSSKDEIISYNELSNDGEIYVGDILLIPNGQMPEQTPVVVAQETPSTSTQVPSGYFISPTQGTITQGSHFSHTSGGITYYGSVDIANSIGTPVVAAAQGTVQIVKNKWPYGKYITILHPNGVITLYAHLSAILVYPGQEVSQGELIGYMGNTGYCISLGGNGSHLHFEVRGASNPLAKYYKGSYVSY